MSLKKGNFSSRENYYMKLALNLARERIGLTGKNPSVGCVIVKNNEIISQGQTSLNGRPHAEFNAIKKCKKDIEESEIYISLEPCSHYGLTPPCTNEIIKSKIKKVFYSIDDIDAKTAKKAISVLKNKKIIVKKNLLYKEGNKIYKSYFFNKKKNYPYTIGKIACSRDFFTSSLKKNITNYFSRQFSHLLRYRNQGILLSSKTINLDNSKLTCRLLGLEKYSPKRFILDKNLNIKINSYVLRSARKIKTYIFFNKSNKKKEKILKKFGAKLIKCKINNYNMINLKEILIKIKKLGINYLLVEGGNKLTTSFVENNLFNEFYLFKSNSKLGSIGKNDISALISKLNRNFNNKKNINTYLDKESVLNYY